MGNDSTAIGRLTVERVRLRSGESVELDGDGAEIIIYGLIGSIVIDDGEIQHYMDLRKTVFSGPPAALLLRGCKAITIASISRTADVLVASAPISQSKRECFTADVIEHDIGGGSHFRKVQEVFGSGSQALVLRCGETLHQRGGWSCWPVHAFEQTPTIEEAKKFEEVFVYFTKPKDGWALQVRKGLHNDGNPVDDTTVIHTGDMAIMPLGFHPVVAAPDTELLYIWFYISAVPKLYAQWAEDLGGYA